MKIRLTTAATALAAALLASPLAQAEQRLIVGDQSADKLVAEGAVDTVTAPGHILEEVGTDTGNFGIGGLVTGTARGSVLAAGQVLRGGARMAVGILDIFTTPFRDETVTTYNGNDKHDGY